MSGLTADARTMVDHARVTGQMHNFTYDEKIGIESCTQAVCDLALRFGESVEDDDALMVSFVIAARCPVRKLTSPVETVRCGSVDRRYRREGSSTVSSTGPKYYRDES